MGYVVKLLAIAHRTEGGIDVRVHPTMIPVDHQLATVGGVFERHLRGGRLRGRDHVLRRGRGRRRCGECGHGRRFGRVARHIQQGIAPIVGCTCTDKLPILPIEELSTEVLHPLLGCRSPGRLGGHGWRVRQSRRERLLGGSARQEGERHRKDVVYVTHVAQERRIARSSRRFAVLTTCFTVILRSFAWRSNCLIRPSCGAGGTLRRCDFPRCVALTRRVRRTCRGSSRRVLASILTTCGS